VSGEYPERDPQLFYELARDRHASQADALTALDAKLGLFVATSGALISIVIAVYAIRPNAFHGAALALLAASGLAWLLLTGVTLYAFQARKWKSGPLLPEVFDLSFTDESDSRLMWRVATVFWRDYDCNLAHLKRKGLALKRALWLFATQTVLLVAALVLVATASGSTDRHSRCPGRAVGGAGAIQVQPVGQLAARALHLRSCRGAYAASATS
jgi:hypothetical protein